MHEVIVSVIDILTMITHTHNIYIFPESTEQDPWYFSGLSKVISSNIPLDTR